MIMVLHDHDHDIPMLPLNLNPTSHHIPNGGATLRPAAFAVTGPLPVGIAPVEVTPAEPVPTPSPSAPAPETESDPSDPVRVRAPVSDEAKVPVLAVAEEAALVVAVAAVATVASVPGVPAGGANSHSPPSLAVKTV